MVNRRENRGQKIGVRPRLRTLSEFWARHPNSEQPLKAWFAEVQAADWRNPQGIKRRYGHASFVADNRVIFNISGNKYRLVARIRYDYQLINVRAVMTHREYDEGKWKD